MTATIPEVAADLQAARYDFTEGRQGSTDRGTKVTCPGFIAVYVRDELVVDIDVFDAPADETVAWLRAVADHIDARMDAS